MDRESLDNFFWITLYIPLTNFGGSDPVIILLYGSKLTIYNFITLITG